MFLPIHLRLRILRQVTCLYFPMGKDDRIEYACRLLTVLFLIDGETEAPSSLQYFHEDWAYTFLSMTDCARPTGNDVSRGWPSFQ